MMKWITGRYGWLLPLAAFLLVLSGTWIFDRERGDRLQAARREAQAVATRRASVLSDQIGNALSTRIGALTAAKLRFTQVEDSVSERVFDAAMDSVTSHLAGLNAIHVLYPDSVRPADRRARRETPPLDIASDTAVANAYHRALAEKRVTATSVLDPTGHRMLIFDPVFAADSSKLLGVLAADIDPVAVVRSALAAAGAADTIRGAFYSVFGPNGVRISGYAAPRDWPAIDLPMSAADTRWMIRLAYPPVDTGVYQAERVATWVTGLAVALAFAVILVFFRKTILSQREEIERRVVAEEAARTSAEEARARAEEARELAQQIEAAQRAAQRLSTSLDPDDVVELFLGGVAETLEADVATLYTFAEEGEVLVGRKRMVFRDVGKATERLRTEDIRQVRVPVAMLPVLAEAVATGEPYVIEDASRGGRPVPSYSAGPEAAPASVTVPLLIGGHTVGVATWEIYQGPRRFEAGTIAFAQALAAPAAAALRSAELFASLESARARATWEALRFGTVLDQMADGVVVVDAKGKVELSNQAAAELLGPELAETPLEQWPARFSLAASDGRPYPAGENPVVRALRGERVRRATFMVRSPWGTERHLSAAAAPILTRTGEPAGAAMVVRDVSDEHEYAEMLRHTNRELRRQAEVLEEVNTQLRDATKAKDQFLAVMSHELRTPINAIMGYSDLLDLEVKGKLNGEQKGMVSRVRDTSRHLLGLINEVLDLAKVGAGRVDLVMVDLKVGTVVERAVHQVMPLAAAKGLSMEVKPAPTDRDLVVVADETRLTQIVINLLSNAVKFTQQGSVTVSFGRTDDTVEIHVRDTGPGIPREQRERIFEEFYQVESGLSRSIGGTGLGLAIARRFARLMNGDITVDSESGKGSEFTIRLPSVDAARPGAPEPQETTVALYSTDGDLIDHVAALLAGSVRIVGATEPARMASLARREEPSLVALDAGGGLPAWRTLAALQADPLTADIEVLLCARQDHGGANALDLGRFTILPKPLSLERAAHAIRAAAAGRLESVLVVGDDADVCRILAESLAAHGSRVQTASNAPGALRAASAERPSVCVVDLMMGEGQGIAALARLRRDAALRDIPVLALCPRALSETEMRELAEAIHRVVRTSAAAMRPLPRLIQEALEDGTFDARAGAA